jgi:hypothetical protein
MYGRHGSSRFLDAAPNGRLAQLCEHRSTGLIGYGFRRCLARLTAGHVVAQSDRMTVVFTQMLRQLRRVFGAARTILHFLR